MWKDPIVEEVRKVRHKHAAKKFNNDIEAIIGDLREQEQKCRRKLASLKPKKPPAHTVETRVSRPPRHEHLSLLRRTSRWPAFTRLVQLVQRRVTVFAMSSL